MILGKQAYSYGYMCLKMGLLMESACRKNLAEKEPFWHVNSGRKAITLIFMV